MALTRRPLARAELSAVVVDIDNTLFDWLKMWSSAFSAMLEILVRESGVARDVLLADFKKVHQQQGTVEYSFSIEELPTLRQDFPDVELTVRFQSAIRAYREERRRNLVLYPGVAETLMWLRRNGIAVAAYTESQAFLAKRRIQWLGLDGLIDILYSTPDHSIPDWVNLREIRRYSDEHYELKQTKHVVLNAGEHKPSPEVLLRIIDALGTRQDQVIYVGDSLHHDIWMAQQAGVMDAWAKYGLIPSRREYDLLVAVTHWDDERVARERALREIEVRPTAVLRDGFSDLLTVPEMGGILSERIPQRRHG